MTPNTLYYGDNLLIFRTYFPAAHTRHPQYPVPPTQTLFLRRRDRPPRPDPPVRPVDEQSAPARFQQIVARRLRLRPEENAVGVGAERLEIR